MTKRITPPSPYSDSTEVTWNPKPRTQGYCATGEAIKLDGFEAMSASSENWNGFEFGELISVVIPTYNRGTTIRRAIESVLSQSYSNLELIVVDDGSTDETAAILAEISDDRMRIITHERNKGAGGARNTGARNARGGIIAFQDSDDEWLKNKLIKQMSSLVSAGPGCVAGYCIKIVYGRDQFRTFGERRAVCVPGPDEPVVSGDLSARLREQNLISTQTLLCSRRAFLETNGFDENLKSSEEWDLVLRLSALGEFAFVDEPLVMTYVQSDSISRQPLKGIYSLLTITNKMKRRGVPRKTLAAHWSIIGHKMGKNGLAKRGHPLVRSAVAVDPFNRFYLLRYGANYLYQMRDCLASPQLRYAIGRFIKGSKLRGI